jgi:hypothetical protein
MSTTVSEVIETQLNLVGAAAYRAGLSGITSVAGLAGSAISALTSVFTPLTAALAGLGTGVVLHEIAAVNSQFEESQRLIAGIFTTMGMSSNFTAGLESAADTMDMITVAAARLPGEAEDYINVFQTGLTSVRQTFGGTTQEMTQFTNQYTAIMSTLGVNSAEAAQLLTRGLSAGRGQIDQQSQAFMRLIPFITQATQGTSHQVANATQFNQLTQEQRGEVLRLTLAQQGLVEMLDDAGTSWGAQTGALASMMRMMGRVASSPLFDAMKTWLGQFNALFMDSEGSLTTLGGTLVEIGRYLSEVVVAGVNNLIEFIGPGVEILSDIGSAVGDILGPLFSQLFDIGQKGVGALDGFWPAVRAVVDNALIPFIDMMYPVLTVLVDMFGFFQDVNMIMSQRLAPTLGQLWDAVGHLFSSITTLLAPMAIFATNTNESVGGLDLLIIAIEVVVNTLTLFMETIAKVNNMFSHFTGGDQLQQSRGPGLGELIAQRRAVSQIEEMTRRIGVGIPNTGTPQTPAMRPSAGVHQDFRNSRFDITQKFAEGFDPDRIAVAFADDVGRLGEQRLQSGLEPLFGVR